MANLPDLVEDRLLSTIAQSSHLLALPVECYLVRFQFTERGREFFARLGNLTIEVGQALPEGGAARHLGAHEVTVAGGRFDGIAGKRRFRRQAFADVLDLVPEPCGETLEAGKISSAFVNPPFV